MEVAGYCSEVGLYVESGFTQVRITGEPYPGKAFPNTMPFDGCSIKYYVDTDQSAGVEDLFFTVKLLID